MSKYIFVGRQESGGHVRELRKAGRRWWLVCHDGAYNRAVITPVTAEWAAAWLEGIRQTAKRKELP